MFGTQYQIRCKCCVMMEPTRACQNAWVLNLVLASDFFGVIFFFKYFDFVENIIIGVIHHAKR